MTLGQFYPLDWVKKTKLSKFSRIGGGNGKFMGQHAQDMKGAEGGHLSVARWLERQRNLKWPVNRESRPKNS